jgi:hypothetical protein
MTLATKNGVPIIQGGKIVTDCGCCGSGPSRGGCCPGYAGDVLSYQVTIAGLVDKMTNTTGRLPASAINGSYCAQFRPDLSVGDYCQFVDYGCNTSANAVQVSIEPFLSGNGTRTGTVARVSILGLGVAGTSFQLGTEECPIAAVIPLWSIFSSRYDTSNATATISPSSCLTEIPPPSPLVCTHYCTDFGESAASGGCPAELDVSLTITRDGWVGGTGTASLPFRPINPFSGLPQEDTYEGWVGIDMTNPQGQQLSRAFLVRLFAAYCDRGEPGSKWLVSISEQGGTINFSFSGSGELPCRAIPAPCTEQSTNIPMRQRVFSTSTVVGNALLEVLC